MSRCLAQYPTYVNTTHYRGYQHNLCLDWRHHRNPLINWLVRLLLTQASAAWMLV